MIWFHILHKRGADSGVSQSATAVYCEGLRGTWMYVDRGGGVYDVYGGGECEYDFDDYIAWDM